MFSTERFTIQASLNRLYWPIYSAMLVWCLFIFTSFSISAAGHILILLSFIGLIIISPASIPEGFKNKSAKTLLAMVLIGILSVISNWGEIERPIKNILKLKYYLLAALSIPCFSLIQKEFLNEKRVRLLLNLFFLSLVVANLSGIVALITEYHPLRMKPACHPDRACGMYGMYMTYGYGIQFVAVMLVGLFLKRELVFKHFNKILFYGALISSIAGLILSYSRGAWIGFAIALPFFFLKTNKKRFLAIITTLTLLAGLTVLLVPKVKQTFFSASRQESNMIRLSQFQAAIHAFKESPILGKGHRNFEPQSKNIKEKYGLKFPGFGGHAHNNFFEDLASKGILGLICLILFHFFWLKESYKRNDIIGYCTFPIVIAFFISGQFQYTFGDGENLFYLMFIYSLSQLNSVGGNVEA